MENNEWQLSEGYSLEEIGQRIRALREKKGWTQEEIASKLHLTRSAWKAKEEGRGDLKTELIIQLSRLFNVTTDFLLTGIDAQNVNISRAIGLNEASIRYLRGLKHGQELSEMEAIEDGDEFVVDDGEGASLAAANALLGEKRGQQILDEIWEYLQSDYKPAFVAVGGPESDTTVDSIPYWVGTGKAGEARIQFTSIEYFEGFANAYHLDRISSNIEAWKKERNAATESTAPRRRRKKEGTGNAAKE